ncbi:hypothetical protein NKG05_03075 [Oerskovia sp. M15]
METVWLVLGIVILALTLLDVFLTALNYDEAGFIAGPLASVQWRLLRRVTRRISRRRRPLVLRQVTGLQIMSTVVAWLFGVILGFGLIYYGQMSRMPSRCRAPGRAWTSSTRCTSALPSSRPSVAPRSRRRRTCCAS